MNKKLIAVFATLLLALVLVPFVTAAPDKNPNFPTREEVVIMFEELEDSILLAVNKIAGFQEVVDELTSRVEELETPDAYFEHDDETLDMKAQASGEGLHVTTWLENYLDDKDNDGWKLYYVEHVPLGSGDKHMFKRHILYGNDVTSWEYLVEQVDWKSETDPFDYLATYFQDKESDSWELIGVNKVTWAAGPYWDVGDLFYFRR